MPRRARSNRDRALIGWERADPPGRICSASRSARPATGRGRGNGPGSAPSSLQLTNGLVRHQNPAVLHRQGLQACAMKVGCVRGDGVGDDRGLEALMKGASRGVLDANLRDGSRDENGIDVMCDEQVGEPCAMESVVTVLVDLSLLGPWRQLVDDGHAIALPID